MITKKELVTDIERYANKISRLHFKFEIKRLVQDRVDTAIRKDIETIATALKNSIKVFERRYKESAKKPIVEKVGQIKHNLNSKTPKLIKPQT